MRTFAQFIENKSNSLVPSSPNTPLAVFLDTLVGSTIKDILDKSSYTNLYLGNKYGFSNPDEADKLLKDFVNKLVGFVNKDVLKHRPSDRLYDTQEFKDKHNYSEYAALDAERRGIFKKLIGSSREERAALLNQKSEIEDRLSNTEYNKARRDIDASYDEAVKRYHNKPLTRADLSDDGSEEYRELENAYNEFMAVRPAQHELETSDDDGDYIDV